MMPALLVFPSFKRVFLEKFFGANLNPKKASFGMRKSKIT